MSSVPAASSSSSPGVSGPAAPSSPSSIAASPSLLRPVPGGGVALGWPLPPPAPSSACMIWFQRGGRMRETDVASRALQGTANSLPRAFVALVSRHTRRGLFAMQYPSGTRHLSRRLGGHIAVPARCAVLCCGPRLDAYLHREASCRCAWPHWQLRTHQHLPTWCRCGVCHGPVGHLPILITICIGLRFVVAQPGGLAALLPRRIGLPARCGPARRAACCCCCCCCWPAAAAAACCAIAAADFRLRCLSLDFLEAGNAGRGRLCIACHVGWVG